MVVGASPSVGEWCAVGLITAAFCVSPLYLGGTIGAFAVCLAACALLLAGAVVLRTAAQTHVEGVLAKFVAALGVTACLALSHQASLSADTSIVPTWVLALLPMTFVAASLLRPTALRALLAACFGAILLVTAVAFLRFLILGERPTLPLIDPNNFATVVYLAWIPVAHLYLSTPGRLPTGWHAAAVGVTLVMAVTLFAADSRAGNLVVAGALAIWGLLALAGRLPRGRVAAIGSSAGCAFVLVLAMRPDGAPAWSDADSLRSALDVRLALIGVAWQIFLEQPWTGVGIACFRLLYAVMRPAWEQETLGAFVHNDYVQFLAEGGVPLTLCLLVFAAGVCLAFVRSVSAPSGSAEFARAGYAMALGAACVHAGVNFTFYIAPLAILLGVISAALWQGSGKSTSLRSVIAVPVAGLAFGWVAWLFFVVDNLSYGVFYAEPFPAAEWIRESPERALRYARVATQMNDDRALPVLGAASILRQQALREPDSRYLRERALADFRQAIAIDPWNPVAYLDMSQHVAAFPVLAAELNEDESEEALLLKALTVDPDHVPAIEGLRDYYFRTGQPHRYAALLEVAVLPRLEAFKRNGEDVVARYMDEIEAFARVDGDEAVLKRVAAERERLSHLGPVRIRVWGDLTRAR